MKCTSVAGASLGILLLASLKNASTVPASSGRAIATLDSGEPSDTPYSERVTVALGEPSDTPYSERVTVALGEPSDTPYSERVTVALGEPSDTPYSERVTVALGEPSDTPYSERVTVALGEPSDTPYSERVTVALGEPSDTPYSERVTVALGEPSDTPYSERVTVALGEPSDTPYSERVTVALGEPSDTPYSERVTVALKRWILKADKCAGSLEIWYKNQCHELASRDAPSCAANQWLVLEKPKESDQRRYIRVKPKCVEIPCKVRTVWWGPLQKCIHVNYAEEVCGKGNVFRVDPFGDIHCACPFAQGQLTDGDDCPEYYQRGPRKNDEGSVSTPEKCTPDSGCSENKLKYAGKEKARSAVRREANRPPEEFSITDQIKGAPCHNFDPITRKCPGGVSVEPGPKEPYDHANRGPFN